MLFAPRRLARLLPGLLLAGGVACDAGSFLPDDGGPRPDLIVVSIDSLRSDHLGAYGYARDTSPTIDRLAEEGVRFENVVSTTSWTLPAHAALFTGLYDSAHGLVFDGLRLGEGHVTLAEVLREAGYHTAGFYGGPYLHPTFGLDQGFELWESCMTKLPEDLSGPAARRQARGGVDRAHADVTGPRTLEEVGRWLEEAGDSRPFFLFLHLWDVHYDYIPPERFVARFDPDYEGDLTSEDFARNPRIHADMPERDLEHLVALYDGEIRFTDHILGRILERLDERGRLENAIVVVTADHGDEFFEHGGKGHRRTLFDEVLRVPLVVWAPGRADAGSVVETQVRLLDLMPTLLSLAGVELPVAVQGRDLTPLLRGGSLPPVPALAELHGPRKAIRALRTNREKLIADGEGRFWHYDLEEDAGEQHPRPAEPAALRSAAGRLRELVASVNALREELGPRRAEPARTSPAMRERLRALGYLEEEEDPAPPDADPGP